jgi:hypothetical protein
MGTKIFLYIHIGKRITTVIFQVVLLMHLIVLSVLKMKLYVICPNDVFCLKALDCMTILLNCRLAPT